MLLTVLRPSCHKDSSFTSKPKAIVPKTAQPREKKKEESEVQVVLRGCGHAHRHTLLRQAPMDSQALNDPER